jgi:hypothetical protein
VESTATGVETLKNRVDALERQNRWMKRVGVAVLLLPVCVALMGQARPNQTVEAQQFVLRDSSGKKWAALQLVNTEPVEVRESVPPLKIPAGVAANLTFYGENGEAKVVLGSGPLVSFLSLNDEKGEPHARISNLGSNTPEVLLNSGGGNEAEIVVDANNGPQIDVRDTNGFSATLGRTAIVTTRTGEQHQTSAASLTLFGKDGKVIWSAP